MFQIGTRALACVVGAAAVAAIVARHRARLLDGKLAALGEPQPTVATPSAAPQTEQGPAAGQEPAGTRRRPCKISFAYELLAAERRLEARLIVDDRRLSSRQAAVLLGQMGIKVGHLTVYRHRNRAMSAMHLDQCGCLITVDASPDSSPA